MSNYEKKSFSHARESIFDKIGPELVFKPAKNSNINADKLFCSPPLTCNLTCKNLCSNEVTEGVFALYKNFLIFFGAENSNSLLSVLDFSNSKLSSMSAFSKFKVVLGKDKFSYELVFPEKKVWELCTVHFQKYCIFTDFNEKYDILETLEHEKHSKMHIIRSHIGGYYYSAKVYDKKEFSQVSLINQIEIMRCLDYKKIIKLIEIHETHDSIYLITEYAHPQTLEKMLKHSKPSAGAAKIIIFSILKALAYMASKGIIHRNITPSNILIEDKRTVKITGFSLATFVTAPEINFGDACRTSSQNQFYDEKSDVFSAGCIFFHLLFGSPLFHQRIIESNIEEILSRENNLDRNKPETDLLLKLLERDPNKRISAKEALRHPYFQKPPVKSQIKLTSRDLITTLTEPSPKPSPRKSSFSSPRSAEVKSPSLSGQDLCFASAIKKSAAEIQKSSQLIPSPRNNQVLKAAIFFNLKNQIKNESAEEIQFSSIVVPLKKKSLSESKLMVSTNFLSQKNMKQKPSADEESEIVCDEGSNVCTDFKKWSGNFITNSPSFKMKII